MRRLVALPAALPATPARTQDGGRDPASYALDRAGALSERAGSAPWAVRSESALEVAAAGAAALGQIAKVGGRARPTPQPGDALDPLARVVGTGPLASQVLGLAP